MDNEISRRSFLLATAKAGFSASLLTLGNLSERAVAQEVTAAAPITLQAVEKTIEINGKSASVMTLVQPNGLSGVFLEANEPFRVKVENKLKEKTAIHWHGLHPPNGQDGVPEITQPPIEPGGSMLYDFPALPVGTHWMHSHSGMQEARLLSAPLIVRSSADKNADEQEVVMMIRDFSFKSPEEIYSDMRKAKGSSSMSLSEMMGMARMPDKAMPASQTKTDLNDVDYDAYLVNDRTLNDPEVVKVERKGRVRLRVINGSSGTNCFIDLGQLEGEVIAVDGMPIAPKRGQLFPIATAQRLDIRLQLPDAANAYPILALREGAYERTGIILTTPGGTAKRLPEKSLEKHGALNLDFESSLRAIQPLNKKIANVTHALRLTGDMSKYIWSINDKVFDLKSEPEVKVKLGERVELKLVNETAMSHPIHLHGHSFQVTEIDSNAINGAVRDTILVPPKSSVSVQFDANNPGLWFIHCHIIWHLEAGMAATLKYKV